jgi:serine/threonine protein kinase/tetratricopeptide (TPR) repeat protein
MPPFTPDQWQEVSPYLDEVLEIAPEQQAAWLLSLQEKDARLASMVEAVLVQQQRLEKEDFLVGSPLAGPARLAGQKIGAYTLVSQIGQGGMGSVWLAQQSAPLQRQVAIKLIRWGMYDDTLLHRFQAERQSLAAMDHPAIAKVFDAGATSEGQPYFVMEFVAGVPITDYCDQKKLKIAARLELFIKVCEGVQHAHQKAIIHRDLKPANILVVEVDGKAVPRIIDFGLAKAINRDITGETLNTLMGTFVGTPGYMSPEQCDPTAKDIDTRTDVYSLGVVLYALLTGRLPFDTSEWKEKPLDEVLRRHREEDPVRPSTKVTAQGETSSTTTAKARGIEPKQLVSVLRGDLDWITMKAVEKDRTRRYATASDLAADMRRYLGNEAVTARPASVGYRARKYVQRHKALVVGAAAVFLVLVAGVITSTWQAVEAHRAEAQVRQQSAIAQAVSDFLQHDLLAQAGAATQSGPSAKPDPDLKVRTALDRAADRIEGKFAKQPEVEAAIRNTIGLTYTDLGLFPEAAKQLKQAFDLRHRVLGPEHPDTLTSMNNLAAVYIDQQRYAEAEGLDIQILEIRRRVLGPEHPDTLSSMSHLAIIYWGQGKYAQSEALNRQTLEIYRRVLGVEHPDTLKCMSNLAVTYYDEGKYPQAEALDTQILEIRRRVLGPEHPDTLTSMANLANLYDAQGKYAQAEALDSQTLEIRRRVLGPEHPRTLDSLNNLANLYDAQGRYAQAEALHSQALEIERRVLGPEHPDTINSMNNLANLYCDEGKYAQAETLQSRTFEMYRRVLGPEHPFTLYSLSDLAVIYQRQGKYSSAETSAAQALAGRRHTLGSEHPSTMVSAADLATAYVSQGKFKDSEPLAREALEFEQKKQLDDWQRFRAESLLGASLAGEKKYAEAEPLLVEGYHGMLAREVRMAAHDRYHLQLAHQWLVQLYKDRGNPQKAVEMAKEPEQ